MLHSFFLLWSFLFQFVCLFFLSIIKISLLQIYLNLFFYALSLVLFIYLKHEK